MRVSKNKLIKVQYTLYASDEDIQDELIEQTQEGNPLVYIHGIGMMLEEFENNLLGLEEGEKFDFTLQPAEAYGEYSEDNLVELPKDVFFVEGQFDEEMVREGATIPMMTADGHTVQGVVQTVSESTVTMDFNHDLAGRTLNFKGHIESVSEPTPEEADALLHPHGGCGCGCGHEHSKDCGCC